MIIEDVREHVYKRVMFISLGLIIEGNLLDSTFIRVSLLEREFIIHKWGLIREGGI